MPETGKKLGPAELAVIERWIAAGAKTARAEPERPPTIDVSEDERRALAFEEIATIETIVDDIKRLPTDTKAIETAAVSVPGLKIERSDCHRSPLWPSA